MKLSQTHTRWMSTSTITCVTKLTGSSRSIVACLEQVDLRVNDQTKLVSELINRWSCWCSLSPSREKMSLISLSEVESKLRSNVCAPPQVDVRRRYVYLFSSILLNGGSIRLWTMTMGLHRSPQLVCCWKTARSQWKNLNRRTNKWLIHGIDPHT